MEIRLKGWQAVVVLLAIVAFLGFRFATARATVGTEGAEVLRQWVAAEYQRYHLDRTDLSDEERARVLLATDSVRFRTVSGRGSPDDMVVRVEIEPSSAHPPDTPYVRYYRMEYSTVTGWHHRGNVTALAYHLAFF
jgi:hypothetical protein